MNSEFKVLEKDERSYLVAEPFEKLGVINGFSRRLGEQRKNQRFKFWIQSRRRF